LFDRSIIVALQGFADDLVDFALRCQQVLYGPGIAKHRDHDENAVAVAGVVVPFVPVQIATQPGGGRTDPGKKKQREPEVVAVLVQKGPLGPVDDRCGAPVHGGLRLLLRPGLRDVRGAGDTLRDRVADSEKLSVEGRRLGFGQSSSGQDEMVDADGVDLVLRPGRFRVEDTARNFLGFVAGVLQGDGLGRFDRKKFRSPTRSRSRGDRVGSDLAVERTDGEVRVEGGVLRELFDLVRPELGRRNPVGIHAGTGENGPK
jgi:hypothetical protein